MNPILFFRLALPLPLLVPIISLMLSMNFLSGFLFLSIGFGGAQYAIFAAYLFFWAGRVNDVSRIRRFTYFAPLAFIPVQWAGWIIYAYTKKMLNPGLENIWSPLLPFAVYIIFIGYMYVGIYHILYAAICKNTARVIEP